MSGTLLIAAKAITIEKIEGEVEIEILKLCVIRINALIALMLALHVSGARNSAPHLGNR
jgi:hypothetical protein